MLVWTPGTVRLSTLGERGRRINEKRRPITLGPDKARKVSRRYDDEGAGDDERVFREGAYVRCGLLALILAVFGLGVRLRRVAGAPTTRRLASRSIELTSHAS